MRYANEHLVFSPSDLVVFLDSEFASWMDRWRVECSMKDVEKTKDLKPPFALKTKGLVCSPDETTADSEIIARMGMDHEAAYLQRLLDKGHGVQDIKKLEIGGQVDATIEAMQNAAEYIYQARLKLGRFEGLADFLVKSQGTSKLGGHSYLVLDTKLARSVKPYFIVQLCSYSEMLEPLQGELPATFSIVLRTGEPEVCILRKYLYYFRSLKRNFLGFHDNFSLNRFPHPGLSGSHGRWSTFATEFLEAEDHLCQVANITRNQIMKLETAGIGTMTDLAKTAKKAVPRLAPPMFERLKAQASLQVKSKGKAKPLYELGRPDPNNSRKGLALLPPPSVNDVFFDIEGFPLAEDGLEYLMGAICLVKGKPKFFDWWAHDQVQEKKSFEQFIDWLHGRWKADPTLHVYHYASYEVQAMHKLMGKHATREREVDDLLRNHVFIDLYTVVRQGLVIGTLGYSLKDIECLYMNRRAGEITDAGGSIVAYHAWMESGQSEDWKESPILKEIRDYNEVDCESTRLLAEWLRRVQMESDISYIPPPSPKEQTTNEEDHPSKLLAEKLLREVENGKVANLEKAETQKLLAWVLEYHWREAKPVFWKMFARHEMTEQELIDDLDCLGGLERTATAPRKVLRSIAYEYKYDPDQNTKLHEGSKCYFAHDLQTGTMIERLDMEQGIVEIKLGPRQAEPPERLCLIPNEYVSAAIIANAVFRYVEAWSDGTILSQAIDDLLHHRPPRLKGHRTGSIIPAGLDLLSATVDVVRRMNNTVLCIQGPPGTGKTYTAARAILKLLQDGRKVGVTANSHKAILNVLRAVHEAMEEANSTFRIVKVGSTEDDPLIADGTIENIDSSTGAAAALVQGAVVMGGTAWVFSREDLQGAFDYLFIDEAGQFSLANTVGVALSAKNLVLVGDQMQLAQPVQGTHPGESGQSALNYLLAGHQTIPPEIGIFLDQTWRLHPDICGFVSAAVYEGRLKSHPRTATQRIKPNGGLLSKKAGIEFIAVEHDGNMQGSEEEVDVIEQIVTELTHSSVWDAEASRSRPLTMADILIVAPFNMQVRLLKKRLSAEAKVGSIDKFQGQEAHVVILSMCSSTLEDSPRGADFLLDPNRLNVAISRAKSLAVIVGNPGLIAARCRTIREMELANLFCWLVDYSRGEA